MSAARLISYVKSLFRRGRIEDDLSEELQFHLQNEIQKNITAGMNPKEARNAALRSFGGVDQVKEQCRDVGGTRFLDELWQDVRYGLRMLRKNPAFTAVAVLTLALGIGANTAIFSLVDTTLRYQFLHQKDFDRLLVVILNNLSAGRTVGTYADYLDLRDQNQVFEQLAASAAVSFVMTAMNKSEAVAGRQISENLFPMMGVPVLGRTFVPEDGEQVLLLGNMFWKRHFRADPGILGKSLNLDGRSYIVVGVAPPGTWFSGSQIFVPFSREYKTGAERLGELKTVSMIGKVKMGLRDDRIRSDLSTIVRRMEHEVLQAPAGTLNVFMWAPPTGWSVSIHELLYILQCAVGLVLLIVSGNVASLLLARSAARRKEFATRLALGAGRLRLLRQLITEGLLLVTLGGLLGWLLAIWGTNLLFGVLLRNFPAAFEYLHRETGFSWSVLTFTVAISFVSGILFSLFPALHVSEINVIGAIKQGMAPATGLSRLRGRHLVVSLQVALALVLVIGASLLIKGRTRVHGVFAGRDADKVLDLTLTLDRNQYRRVDQIRVLYDQLLAELRSVPGVRAAEVTAGDWLHGDGPVAAISTLRPRSYDPQIQCVVVTSGYLTALEVPVRKGRHLTEEDLRSGVPVALVNETLVRRFMGNVEDPVGRVLKVTAKFLLDGKPVEDAKLYTIVGVAADVKRVYGYAPWKEDVDPEIYIPYTQSSQLISTHHSLYVVIRTDSDPQNLLPTLKSTIWTIDKRIVISGAKTMKQWNSEALAYVGLFSALLGIFGALAVLLSIMGIYGVLTQLVNQGAHEIGVRITLGAQRRDVLWLVSIQGLKLTSLGLVLGLIASYSTTQVLSSYVFGLSTTDPATFVGVSTGLLIVAGLACYIPARRATKVDPIVALRYE